MGDLDHIKYTILLAEPTHNPKRQLHCFTWFYTAMPQILHSLQWVVCVPLACERLLVSIGATRLWEAQASVPHRPRRLCPFWPVVDGPRGGHGPSGPMVNTPVAGARR